MIYESLTYSLLILVVSINKPYPPIPRDLHFTKHLADKLVAMSRNNATIKGIASPTPVDLVEMRLAFEEADEAALIRRLNSIFPDPDNKEKVRSILRFDGVNIANVFDANFAKVINKAISYVRLAQVQMPRPLRIESVDEDYIAQLSGIEEWNIDQCLARLCLERMPIKHKAAVVGTMRDDGIYILQWVAHYRLLGFEHLFIYTNDNADGSDELLARLAEAGLITVIYNEVTREVPPETKAFGHALNLLPALWEFEWALFIDSDEYLMPADVHGFSIEHFLDHVNAHDPAQNIGAILFDWLWMVSDMAFKREPGLLCERFQHAREHFLGKCMVRLRDVTSMRRQHTVDLMPGKTLVDSTLNPLDSEGIWQRKANEYAGGQINHYWPRSFEEFAIKKARGASLGGEQNEYDRPYKQFFEWNGPALADNHWPTSRSYLSRLHAEIFKLRALPGVQEAASNIELGFKNRLASIGSEEELHRLYKLNEVPPSDL
jgi:Glycosyl transferase family 2